MHLGYDSGAKYFTQTGNLNDIFQWKPKVSAWWFKAWVKQANQNNSTASPMAFSPMTVGGGGDDKYHCSKIQVRVVNELSINKFANIIPAEFRTAELVLCFFMLIL